MSKSNRPAAERRGRQRRSGLLLHPMLEEMLGFLTKSSDAPQLRALKEAAFVIGAMGALQALSQGADPEALRRQIAGFARLRFAESEEQKGDEAGV